MTTFLLPEVFFFTSNCAHVCLCVCIVDSRLGHGPLQRTHLPRSLLWEPGGHAWTQAPRSAIRCAATPPTPTSSIIIIIIITILQQQLFDRHSPFSTHVSRHPQLTTREFCCSRVFIIIIIITSQNHYTGLTSWTLTRWRDQHTSDKVAHYSIYQPRKDERLPRFWLHLGRRLARLPTPSSAQPCLYRLLPVPAACDRPSIQATPVVTHLHNPITIYK